MAVSTAIATTSKVVTSVSCRLGHVTLAASARTSRTNFAGANAKSRILVKAGKRGRGENDKLAGVEGLEPPASGFGDRRSSQLSYTPAARKARYDQPGKSGQALRRERRPGAPGHWAFRSGAR